MSNNKSLNKSIHDLLTVLDSFDSPHFVGFEGNCCSRWSGVGLCRRLDNAKPAVLKTLSSKLDVCNKNSELWYSDEMVILAFFLRITEAESSSLSYCSSGSIFLSLTQAFFRKVPCHFRGAPVFLLPQFQNAYF